MLLSDFILKAEELTIERADNGLYYLIPTWRSVLEDNQLDILDISDSGADEDEIEDVLKLEVKKRNTVNSLFPYVMNWVHDVITASIEPAVLQEETDYLKTLTEYLKTNKDIQLKQEEWDKFKET